MVFNLSGEFQGVSLNKELLPGPDVMNSLVGVLIRFCQDNIAMMCDIDQMLNSFHVDPKHQNFQHGPPGYSHPTVVGLSG